MEGKDGDQGIPASRLGLTFVIGTAIGVALVLIWAATSNTVDPVEQATRAGVAQSQAPRTDSPAVAPQAVGSARMERCVDAAQALRAPVAAARPALDQWNVHVGAMNKLVAGDITLQQATVFWDRTRLGARRHVDRFRAEWAELRRHGVDCPSPALMAPGTPALRPCARQVEAEVRVLEAAKRSIDTWDKHVRDMEMLRMGMLSPEDATQMWLSMWRRGVRDLDAYRQATRNPTLTKGCPTSASSG